MIQTDGIVQVQSTIMKESDIYQIVSDVGIIASAGVLKG